MSNYSVTSQALTVSKWIVLTTLPHVHLEDTDDETGQVLHGMDSLPPVLRRYVHEDNRWFQQELSEWEAQFCQTATPQGESTASAEPPELGPVDVPQAVVEPAPQSGPTDEELDQAAPSGPEPDADPEPDPTEKPNGEFELFICLITHCVPLT